MCTKETDCAEYMLFALFDTEKGASLRKDKGDEVPFTSVFPGTSVEEAQRKLWDHSVEETKSKPE